MQPPTAQEANDRQLTALRARLTRKRTAVLNGIHKILAKHNLEQACPTKKFQTKKVRRWLAEIELPALDRLELDLLVPQWELLDEQLETVQTKLVERVAADEQARLLESVPGMGHYSALAIASRIGNIERFKHADSLANFFGLTPGCRNSGEATQRLGSITKRGSKMVRYLLEPGGDQGPAVRRRDADVVQADQEASRVEDRAGGGDAPPGDDPLAHAEEEAEVPLRFADQEAQGNRDLGRNGGMRQRTEGGVYRGASPEPPKDLRMRAQRGMAGRHKEQG